MYPKRKAKSDRERFLDAFKKRVGAAPKEYVRRKLASGMDEAELKRLYDMLAVEIARRAHCTAVRFDELQPQRAPGATAKMHRERAASQSIPTCKRCGARMVLRTAQKGPRAGEKFWGCSNYPVCRFTMELEEHPKS